MRRSLLLCLAPLLVCHAASEGLADYLKLRRQYKIVQPAGVAALETLVGERVFEISGKVKGTFRVGEKGAIMLERTGGDVQVIECGVIPSWLVGNEVSARLIVRAVRRSEYGELEARLLAAAPESEVAMHDRRTAEKAKTAKPNAGRAASRTDWYLPASEVTPIYADFIRRYNKRLSPREAEEIAVGVVGFSLMYGVDARLIMAMVIVESGFNPRATSRAGAMGLGQLMPGTAAGMGVTNAYDKTQNLYGTVRLIRGHLDKYRRQTGQDYKSLVLALAAYNAGGGAVKRHGGVPPYRETQNYVRKVIATYRALAGHG